MDIHNLEQIKQEFSGFQQEFETGNKEKALEKLLELLDALEEADTSRRAAQIDKCYTVIGNPGRKTGGRKISRRRNRRKSAALYELKSRHGVLYICVLLPAGYRGALYRHTIWRILPHIRTACTFYAEVQWGKKGI